jgi:hypothetical protein
MVLLRAFFVVVVGSLLSPFLMPSIPYDLYVPIEIQTCTSCSDKVIDLPPHHVSQDGKTGSIQVVAVQKTDESIGVGWSPNGFADPVPSHLPAALYSQPIKTIVAPCICSTPGDSTPPTASVKEFILAAHPDNVSLQDVTQWYHGKKVLSYWAPPPKNGAIAGPQMALGLVHLLPAPTKDGVALQPLSSNTSTAQGNGSSQPRTLQDGQRTFIAYDAGNGTADEQDALSNNSQSPRIGFVPITSTFYNRDLRDMLLTADQIKILSPMFAELKNMPPIEQSRAFHQKIVQLKASPQQNGSFSALDYPATYKAPESKIRWVVGVDNNYASTGPAGDGLGCKLHFNTPRTNSRRSQVVHNKKENWKESLRVNRDPQTYSADFFRKQVLLAGYYDGMHEKTDPTTYLFDYRLDCYQYDEYITLLKRCPDYSTRILALKKRIDTNRDQYFDDYWEFGYHIWPNDKNNKPVGLPQFIDHLAQEIHLQQEAVRANFQKKINDEFERRAREAYRKEYHEAERKLFRMEGDALTTLLGEQYAIFRQPLKREAKFEHVIEEEGDTNAFSRPFNSPKEIHKQELLELTENMFDGVIEEFAATADANPTNPWAQEDAQTLQQMNTSFQQNFDDDPVKAQRWAQRINSVTTEKKNKNNGPLWLSKQFKSFIEDNGFNLKDLDPLHYDARIVQIQRETVEILENVYVTQQRYGHFYDVDRLQKYALWAARAAQDVCCIQSPTRTFPAFHLLEVAHEFQAAAQELGEYLATARNAAWHTSTVIGHITGRTIQLLGKRAYEILKDPLPYAGNILFIAVAPDLALAHFVFEVCANRKQIAEFCTHMATFARNNPKEAAAYGAAFAVECALTGRLIKNASQLSKHAKEFAQLLHEEQMVAAAAGAAGVPNATLTPLTNASAKATAATTTGFVGRVITQAELAVANQINAAKGALTPSLVQLCKTRATTWLNEFKQNMHNTKFQISEAAANYQEIFDMIPEFFGGSLKDVFLSEGELLEGTLALFKDFPATNTLPPIRIKFRLCSTPKGPNNYNPNQMVVNLERHTGKMIDGSMEYARRANGHLPVVHPQDFTTIEAKIKNLNLIIEKERVP